MDIKLKLSEILGLNKNNTDNEEKKGLSIFGGGFHLHFHISINPTFMQKEKEEKE